MPLSSWVRPPRHLFVLFVGVTAVSAGALGWATWQLIQQDRALARQRAVESRDHLAGLVVEGLQARLAGVEDDLQALAATPPGERDQRLADYGARLPDGATILTLTSRRVGAYPTGRLLYFPAITGDEPEAELDGFDNAVRAEQRGDLAGAEALLAPVASDPDDVRAAGALVILGRVQRQADQWFEALATYQRLEEMAAIRILGIPADLVARRAMLDVLGALDRTDERLAAARQLRHDLQSGRWRLTRAVYDDSVGILEEIPGSDPVSASGDPILSEAALALWSRRQGAGQPRRRTMPVGDQPVLVVEQDAAGARLVFVAHTGFLETTWLAEIATDSATADAQVTLTDLEGHVVAGPGDPDEASAIRLASKTGLPWTVSTSTRPSAAASGLGDRGRVFAAGIAAVGLLVIGGSYLIGRAVSRELRVARLQADFVSAVSHEFRTPLTAIRQLSEMLVHDRAPTDALRRQYYGAIRHESERLHRLVEGLLKFGRMEAGAIKFQFEDLDAGAFVESVVADFRREAERQGFEVAFAKEGDAVSARADREALGAALWNLLENAVKYSPECRTIWVDAVLGAPKTTIRVRDRGIGIGPEDRDRIFGRFVRGQSAGTLGVQGTGLGLAVARRIVERHGGELTVESERGAGSTFTVSLPAVAAVELQGSRA